MSNEPKTKRFQTTRFVEPFPAGSIFEQIKRDPNKFCLVYSPGAYDVVDPNHKLRVLSIKSWASRLEGNIQWLEDINPEDRMMYQVRNEALARRRAAGIPDKPQPARIDATKKVKPQPQMPKQPAPQIATKSQPVKAEQLEICFKRKRNRIPAKPLPVLI